MTQRMVPSVVRRWNRVRSRSAYTNFAFERVVAQLIDMRAAEGFAKYDALALGQTGAVDCRQECLPARRWNVRVAGEYAPLEQTSRIGSSAGLHNVQSNAFHD